jgi:Fur family ferric uptake transcriptional regulator
MVGAMTKKAEPYSISEVRQLLSRSGLRTTPARTAVLRRLKKAKAPATHAEIAADLVPLGVDKATVFRNLNDLVEPGLVSRTELGDHVWRFGLRDPDHVGRGQHPHFVCVDCGRVTCLHDLDLPKSARKLIAQFGQVTEIPIRGRCLACG